MKKEQDERRSFFCPVPKNWKELPCPSAGFQAVTQLCPRTYGDRLGRTGNGVPRPPSKKDGTRHRLKWERLYAVDIQYINAPTTPDNQHYHSQHQLYSTIRGVNSDMAGMGAGTGMRDMAGGGGGIGAVAGSGVEQSNLWARDRTEQVLEAATATEILECARVLAEDLENDDWMHAKKRTSWTPALLKPHSRLTSRHGSGPGIGGRERTVSIGNEIKAWLRKNPKVGVGCGEEDK
ncbi:uncharacterized protein EV422DRAFT_432757 [Fimicolochytrium jonesii]|uniref:uncharacterized protein n=1 Tax=Fimicolochytrium jonesii TaxID=1396493 RepID=UPI0022FDC773|nr:uncharacterized protein EV422DRAFT_432757 [Fimicolochytrium jonesii]KAI8821799.1 hypothetical protein EV422DRAFT_432757 [Fimicolochytrium jonesii]